MLCTNCTDSSSAFRLARYRNQTSQAESYYRHAAQLVPSNGKCGINMSFWQIKHWTSCLCRFNLCIHALITLIRTHILDFVLAIFITFILNGVVWMKWGTKIWISVNTRCNWLMKCLTVCFSSRRPTLQSACHPGLVQRGPPHHHLLLLQEHRRQVPFSCCLHQPAEGAL